MIINHNMSALYANRSLGQTQNSISASMEKLSSGERITKAADDASGLAVSEKMRSQIRGLNQASQNVQNGIAFIQTTEGYLQETQDILQRLRELSVQSANGIYTAGDRAQIQVEVSQLVDEVNRVASHAEFNTMKLLDGSFARGSDTGIGMQIQLGANIDQNEQVFIARMDAEGLGLQGEQGSLDLTTAENANLAISTLDQALNLVSTQRAELGASQNRFEKAVSGIDIAAENLQAAESRIRDADMAKEMVSYSRDQILQQAGTAMLAQANVQTQSVLQLLG
ncbi:MAG: flagellin [Treponema sp.]|nr:flagellin [Treponema sp.]